MLYSAALKSTYSAETVLLKNYTIDSMAKRTRKIYFPQKITVKRQIINNDFTLWKAAGYT